MKVNCDYQTILTAIEKFKLKEKLTQKEHQAITEILETSKGDIIPTEKELEKQEYRVSCLTEKLWETNPDRYKQILDECTEFENKYC